MISDDKEGGAGSFVGPRFMIVIPTGEGGEEQAESG